MKKINRIVGGEVRKAESEAYREQEEAMQEFISCCKDSMTAKEWELYFPEAELSAGETFHIVEYLMFALGKCQTTITPPLRKSFDTMMKGLDINPSEWRELSSLNLDAHWREHYGITEG